MLHTFEIISTRTSVGIGELKSEMEKQADEHLVKLANELIKKHPQNTGSLFEIFLSISSDFQMINTR